MKSLEIPFAPSVAVMRELLRGDGFKYGKDRARCLISGNRLLSIPVEGGASILRNPDISIERIRISDHGRWRQEHLGAWNAAYGKTPFFIHLFPLLEEAYELHSYGSLKEFNYSVFEIIRVFVNYDGIRDDVKRFRDENPGRYSQVINDLETKVNINYSIFDSLFRLGKGVSLLL